MSGPVVNISGQAIASADRTKRIWLVLLSLATLYFIVRGPWRAIHDSNDFVTLYSATRCWLHGMNPYAPVDLLASGRSAGAPVSEEQFQRVPSFYLPSAYPMLAPFAILPWNIAKIVWLCCSLAVTWYAAAAVVRMSNSSPLAIWTALLALAPVHTGISKGQPSVAVCALIILNLVIRDPYAAGVLLGLALCIKPQLALGFLALALALKQWRKLAPACTTAAVFSAIGLFALKSGSLQTLQSNVAAVSSPSGLNSGASSNPVSYQLITIDTLIPDAMHSAVVIAVVSILIVVISAIAVLRTAQPSIAISVVAAATILVGYHRFYDAQILWLGIPMIPLLLRTNRRLSILVLAAYAVFLVPGQTMLAVWLHQPAGVGPLMYHEVLACVAIWIVFIVIASRKATSLNGVLAPPPPPSVHPA